MWWECLSRCYCFGQCIGTKVPSHTYMHVCIYLWICMHVCICTDRHVHACIYLCGKKQVYNHISVEIYNCLWCDQVVQTEDMRTYTCHLDITLNAILLLLISSDCMPRSGIVSQYILRVTYYLLNYRYKLSCKGDHICYLLCWCHLLLWELNLYTAHENSSFRLYRVALN